MPRERLGGWSEPLAPTPLPPASTLNLPLDMDDRRMQSPSNASEISRSHSQGDFYQRNEMARQSSQVYSGGQPHMPIQDDRYYQRGQSIPPPPSRYIPSPQQTVLPPVRLHEPLPSQQQPSYYPNPPSPYDTRMPPPPLGEPGYVRESYTRSPVHQRLPSLPPQIPTSDTRSFYYGDPDRQPYPPFQGAEMYYDRGERGYYSEEERYFRDRRERDIRIDNERRMETERRMGAALERQRAVDRERERDRLLHHGNGEREGWRDRYEQPYAASTPPTRGGYAGRARTPPGRMFYRDYDPRVREEMERHERDRLERLERDRVEMERDRLERERWARR